MNRKILLGGVLGVGVIGLVGAAALYNWVLGPTLAASGQITAIPVLPAASTAVPATHTAPAATDAGVDETVVPEASPTTASISDLTVLQIVSAQSEVRFVLSEVLRGQPTTVIGATDQVAGEIAVDPSDLSTAQVGVIQVNARTLATDNSQRNRAIRNRILNTDDHEFITFAPTQVIGLDGSAGPGDTFAFQLAGDLTIRGVTQPVVFDVTARVDSLRQLSGTATTTVQRSDFNLNIPSVPQVADVSEAVQIELDFVAAAGS
jgi:polyisoprenoid-binding protein YceI